MAGLLLELRRQIAKNHRKGIYGNASVQRRETPNMKDSVPKRNSMADMHQGKMSEKVLQQKEQGVDVKKPMETVLPEMQEESIDHIQIGRASCRERV